MISVGALEYVFAEIEVTSDNAAIEADLLGAGS